MLVSRDLKHPFHSVNGFLSLEEWSLFSRLPNCWFSSASGFFFRKPFFPSHVCLKKTVKTTFFPALQQGSNSCVYSAGSSSSSSVFGVQLKKSVSVSGRFLNMTVSGDGCADRWRGYLTQVLTTCMQQYTWSEVVVLQGEEAPPGECRGCRRHEGGAGLRLRWCEALRQ